MAKLLRLQISGIRNFSPNEDEVANIKFSTPLTLFLGQNGCGKTTIIESLKYACTGDLPAGSNKGQSFIHNPKINRSAITKGQVRLLLSDKKGNNLTIIKSAQVKQERDKIKFESLDSTLIIKKPNGQQESISSRCVDIQNQILITLGTSKAILNYVIFCHQEESLWPLDEGKSLKEKFDQIFDVDNYNKFIEKIRKTMNEKKNKLKVLKEGVADKKNIKDRVERDREKLRDRESRYNNVLDEIKQIETGIEPIHTRYLKILDLQNNIGELDKKISNKNADMLLLNEQKKGVIATIEIEFQGSDEALQEAIEEFQRNCDVVNQHLNKYKIKHQEIEREQANLKRNITETQLSVGKLVELKKQQEERLLEQSNLLTKIANNLKTPVSSSFKNNSEALQTIKVLENALSREFESMQKMQKDFLSEEKELQSKVDKKRESRAQTNQELSAKQRQIVETRQKITSITNQLHDLDVGQTQLQHYKVQVSKLEKDLKELELNFNPQTVASQIEKSKQTIREYEENLESLESDLKILNRNLVLEYDIEKRQQDIVMRETNIKKYKNKHFDNFKKLSKEIPERDYKAFVESNHMRSSQLVHNLRSSIKSKEALVNQLETELRMQNEQLKQCEERLKMNQKAIYEVCEGQSYEMLSKQLQTNIDKLQTEKGQLHSAKVMYRKFINDFKKDNPCCPVCESKFNNNRSAVQKIIETMEEKIKGIPPLESRVEKDLSQKQELITRVLKLGTVNEEVQDLSAFKIPDLKEAISELQSNYKLAKDNLEKLQADLKEPELILQICNIVMGDASLIDQNMKELAATKESLEELKLQLATVPSNKTKQQVEMEIEDIKSELANARNNKDKLQKRLEQNNERKQNLREERSKIVERMLQVEKTMQGKAQLIEQKDDLGNEESKLLIEVEELKRLLNELGMQLEEAEQDKALIRETNRSQLETVRKEYMGNEKLIEDFHKLQKLISKYLSDDVENQLDSVNELLQTYKMEENELGIKKKSVENSIRTYEDQVKNKSNEFKKLNGNVTLREYRKKEKLLLEELNNLKEERGTFNHVSLHNERQKIEVDLSKMNQQVSTLKGSNNTLKGEIKDLQKELSKPENTEAYKAYQSKHLEWECTKKCIDELNIYVCALEQSIMVFHKERMQLVNRIIRDMWRTIYRGNDIDYIEIKNEMTSTATKRVYNYRVVQMKNGVEIDMRGQCSAGQKVLACLIIRMALAETFSTNCGILALDEPTTNLDRENVTSLGDALARLVNARQADKSFQLLIITHDADFLNSLMHVEKVSYYYKVVRGELGNSVVEKQTLY